MIKNVVEKIGSRTFEGYADHDESEPTAHSMVGWFKVINDDEFERFVRFFDHKGKYTFKSIPPRSFHLVYGSKLQTGALLVFVGKNFNPEFTY